MSNKMDSMHRFRDFKVWQRSMSFDKNKYYETLNTKYLNTKY